MRASDLVQLGAGLPAADLPPDFFPPIGYDWWWWLVLPLFIVLLVLWILFSRRFAGMRWWRRRVGAVEVPRKALPLPVNVRIKALTRVDEVEREVAAGTLSPRDAHLECSAILRELAFYTTRYDTRSMTLQDLRDVGLTRLADTVAMFYPIAFAPTEAVDAGPAIAATREAVRQWN